MSSFPVQLTSKDGDNITLDVTPNDSSTVADFRKQLESHDSTTEEAKLIFKGKILKNEMLLKDIGMTEEGLKDGKGKVVFMRAKGKKAAPVPAAVVSNNATPAAVAPAAGGATTGTTGGGATDADGDAVMGNTGAGAGGQQQEEIVIDPEVVDNLLAITGFATTKENIEAILRRCHGNPDMAMNWILDPEGMAQQEQQMQQQARVERQRRRVDGFNVLPFTEGIAGFQTLVPEGLLQNAGKVLASLEDFLGSSTIPIADYLSAKQYVLFFMGATGNRSTRQMFPVVQQMSMLCMDVLGVVYCPFDETDEKFGEMVVQLPFPSLPFKCPSFAALNKRLKIADCGGQVLIELKSGNIMSFTPVNDMALHNWDFNVCKQHWLARGHINKPSPFTKEDPTGAIAARAAGSSANRPQGFHDQGVPTPGAFPQAFQGQQQQQSMQQQQATNSVNPYRPGIAPTQQLPAQTGGGVGGGGAASSSSATPAAAPKLAGAAGMSVLPGGVEIEENVLSMVISLFTDNTPWCEQKEFFATILKVMNNIYDKPTEAKFRSLKMSVAKLFGDGRPGEAILSFGGFVKKTGDDGVEKIELGADVELGKLISVRNLVQKIANKGAEDAIRVERDKKIADEKEKDKGRQTKYGGSDGGGARMNLGGDRKRGGGGG